VRTSSLRWWILPGSKGYDPLLIMEMMREYKIMEHRRARAVSFDKQQTDHERRLWRPFMGCGSNEILKIGQRALHDNNIEVFSYCIAEQGLRRSTLSRRHRAALSEGGLVPVPWIQEAAYTGRSLESTGADDSPCHVYVILLDLNRDDPGLCPEYALYVGQTGIGVVKRFQQHLDGYKSSRHVGRHGVCLLPTFFEHLHPADREEALHLEGKLARALRGRTLCEVFGGH